MSRAPQLFPVPAGSKTSPCRSCGAAVYFVRTGAGKTMPVRTDVEGGSAPTADAAGLGASHFIDCPQREQWRKPREVHA